MYVILAEVAGDYRHRRPPNATRKVGRMALISLFKEQLENESKAIAETRGLEKRGDYLVWWYFLKLPGLSPEAIEEVVCDGFNDQGIDAVWIDDTNTVHFYNFKNPVSISDGFPGVEVDKMLAGLNLIVSREYGKVANESLRARMKTFSVSSRRHTEFI